MYVPELKVRGFVCTKSLHADRGFGGSAQSAASFTKSLSITGPIVWATDILTVLEMWVQMCCFGHCCYYCCCQYYYDDDGSYEDDDSCSGISVHSGV